MNEEEKHVVPSIEDDIMITDLDKQIMNINGDDDLDIVEDAKPMLYNMKKDIKIDTNNMGMSSYKTKIKI